MTRALRKFPLGVLENSDSYRVWQKEVFRPLILPLAFSCAASLFSRTPTGRFQGDLVTVTIPPEVSNLFSGRTGSSSSSESSVGGGGSGGSGVCGGSGGSGGSGDSGSRGCSGGNGVCGGSGGSRVLRRRLSLV